MEGIMAILLLLIVVTVTYLYLEGYLTVSKIEVVSNTEISTFDKTEDIVPYKRRVVIIYKTTYDSGRIKFTKKTFKL